MPDELVAIRRRTRREPAPSLRDVLAILFRQRRLVLLSFAVVFAGALVYAFWSPPYRAEMKILVRRGRLDPPMTAQPTPRSDFVRNDISEEELNSEVELLKNIDLLRKVAEETGLVASEKSIWRWRNPDQEIHMARAVRRLARRLRIEPIRKTRMISVSYRSSDPALAARVLSSLAAAYMEKHVEVHRPSGEFRFFNQQTGRYGQELDAAEGRLLALNNDGVVAAMMERDLTLQKLSEAESSYREIPVAIAETRHRIRKLEAQLTSLPERTTIQVATADNQQLLQHLKTTLLSLQLKRTELLTKFQPSYRLVQEVEQQIAETNDAITAEQLAPARQETTDNDPRRVWVQAELVKAQVELSTLSARGEAARKMVLNYRDTVRRLGQEALEQQDIVRSARLAEENYLLYVRKREEARIGDALDQRGILNVIVVQEPRAPALPDRSPAMAVLGGLFAACAISTGLAFTSDYLDPSFRTPSEVAAYLDAPVLASLPKSIAAVLPAVPRGQRRAS